LTSAAVDITADKMEENSMDIDENHCMGKEFLRSNFGSVTGNNGFNRTTPNLDQCKPGSVKKLVIKNLKGMSLLPSYNNRKCLYTWLAVARVSRVRVRVS